jgi:DNA ligase (NAD+)
MLNLDLLASRPIDELSFVELVELLTAADDLYYNDEESFLTDQEYDTYRKYAQNINPTDPYFLGVGSEVRGGKVALPFQMGSLDQIYTGDIQKYISNNNLHNHTAIVSHKLDGNSGMIVYDSTGKLQIAFSRGDGIEGADITRHYIQIPSIPVTASSSLVVRGECIIKLSAFEQVQKVVKTRNGKSYKNPRNAVSGLMNAKENNPDVYQYIDFVAYEIVNSDLNKKEQLEALKDLGFLTVNYVETSFNDLDDFVLVSLLNQAKDNTEYEIDGIVIDVNSHIKRSILNPTRDTLNPVYSVKFKQTDVNNILQTNVIDVEINLSKDGYLKPRIQVEPVDILGVTVQWATGFNMKFIVDNRIGPGSIVEILRAGDVVPYVQSIIKQMDSTSFNDWYDEKLKDYQCVEWTDTGVDLKLSDTSSSDTVLFEQLVYFFDSLGVSNLGEGNLKSFFDLDFVYPEMILTLTLEDICTVVNSKSIGKKIFQGLKSATTNVPLYKLMGAHSSFGRGVGSRKMKKLYEAFEGNLDRFANLDDIIAVEGFDEKTAKKIVKGYPEFNKFLNYIESFVTLEEYKTPITGKLTDKVFVFTGVRSIALEQQIEKAGGKIGSGVSSKTSYVVTNNVNGSSGKLDKARSLGIEIITLEQAQELV